MLIFIDESWQTVGGTPVATLGAVAVKELEYNRLCSKVYKMKGAVLGARELADNEIKAGVNLAKAQFKRRNDYAQPSLKLDAVDQLFDILDEFEVKTFAVSTTDPADYALRSQSSTTLSGPYVEILYDLKRMIGQDCDGTDRAHLFFDQRDHKQDLALACAVQNYLVRTHWIWGKRFIQVPCFTISAVQPGLQAADIIAYLAGQQLDPTVRPELAPLWARVEARQFVWKGTEDRPALRIAA